MSGKEDGAKGGRARARSLTPEERSEISRIGAQARWGKNPKVRRTICGSLDRPLKLGNIEIPCYVLEGGARVLSQNGVHKGMGLSTGGGKSRSRKIPLLLRSIEEKGLDVKGLTARAESPVEFLPPHGGAALGYEATLLPEFCDLVLEARSQKLLHPKQKHLATQCETIIRSLAKVGIIALVDEATGYQDQRAHDALAKILEEFIAQDLRKWVKTFQTDFYKELFRLRGLNYHGSVKKPQYIGHLTNDIVYSRLAPGVLDELKRQTPKDSEGRHKHQLHRRLTERTGHPKLREHLASVITLMKVSENYDDFQTHLDRIHPKVLLVPQDETN